MISEIFHEIQFHITSNRFNIPNEISIYPIPRAVIKCVAKPRDYNEEE